MWCTHRNKPLRARTSHASARLSALPTSRRPLHPATAAPTPFILAHSFCAPRKHRLHFAFHTHTAHVPRALAALSTDALACPDLPAACLPPPLYSRPPLQCARLAGKTGTSWRRAKLYEMLERAAFAATTADAPAADARIRRQTGAQQKVKHAPKISLRRSSAAPAAVTVKFLCTCVRMTW